MKAQFFGAVATIAVASVNAQTIGGSVIQNVSMTNSKVLTVDVDLKSSSGGGSKDVNVQTIYVGERAKVKGAIYQQAEMKDSLVVVGMGSNVQSIVLGK